MNEDHENLDRLLHEQLRALPDPQPPRHLIPRVLERIAAEQNLPWWKHPWLEWPRALQVLSCALWAAEVGAVYFLRANLASLFHASTGPWQVAPHFFQQAATVVQTLWAVLARLVASHQSHWLTVTAIVVIALYLGVVGLGTAFYRLLATDPFAVK